MKVGKTFKANRGKFKGHKVHWVYRNNKKVMLVKFNSKLSRDIRRKLK